MEVAFKTVKEVGERGSHIMVKVIGVPSAGTVVLTPTMTEHRVKENEGVREHKVMEAAR